VVVKAWPAAVHFLLILAAEVCGEVQIAQQRLYSTGWRELCLPKTTATEV